MSTLVNKKGIAIIAHDLSQRHVFAELVDSLLKGNSDPITVAKLAAATYIPSSKVIEALQGLESAGIIEIGTPWEEVGSFSIGGVSLALDVEQRAMSSITREGPSATSREISGMDQIQIAEDLIRATVLPQRNEDETLTGWSVLNIVRNPGLDGEFLLLDKEFPTAPEAWEYWDEYKDGALQAFESDQDFMRWCQTLEVDAKDYYKDGEDTLPVIFLGPLAFERLAQLVAPPGIDPEAVIATSEFPWEGKGFKSITTGPEYTEPEGGDHEPDNRPTSFPVFIMGKEDEIEVPCEWENALTDQGPVKIDRFTFKHAEQTWVRQIVSARVPTDPEEFEAFAKQLAQEHYDNHAGEKP